MELVSVSREQYKEFVDNHPRLLKYVEHASEPPVIFFLDGNLGPHWLDCVVAKTWAYSDIPGDRYYEPMETRRYYIVKSQEEVTNEVV